MESLRTSNRRIPAGAVIIDLTTDEVLDDPIEVGPTQLAIKNSPKLSTKEIQTVSQVSVDPSQGVFHRRKSRKPQPGHCTHEHIVITDKVVSSYAQAYFAACCTQDEKGKRAPMAFLLEQGFPYLDAMNRAAESIFQGNRDYGILLLKSLVEVMPEVQILPFHLGRAYLKDGSLQKANAELCKLAEHPQVFYQLIASEIAVGQADRARTRCYDILEQRKIAKYGPNVQTVVWAAICLAGVASNDMNLINKGLEGHQPFLGRDSSYDTIATACLAWAMLISGDDPEGARSLANKLSVHNDGLDSPHALAMCQLVLHGANTEHPGYAAVMSALAGESPFMDRLTDLYRGILEAPPTPKALVEALDKARAMKIALQTSRKSKRLAEKRKKK